MTNYRKIARTSVSMVQNFHRANDNGDEFSTGFSPTTQRAYNSQLTEYNQTVFKLSVYSERLYNQSA